MTLLSRYLAQIGARGGRKSRRALDSGTARRMVRVREARRAFQRYHATCFGSFPIDLVIGADQVAWVAEQLRTHGDHAAREVATRLSPVAPTTDADWPGHPGTRTFSPLLPDALPGADLVEHGLRDLGQGAVSVESLLVSIGAPALRALGFLVPRPHGDAELRLYHLLAAQLGNGAHARYNALIRQLVSFQRAAACVT